MLSVAKEEDGKIFFFKFGKKKIQNGWICKVNILPFFSYSFRSPALVILEPHSVTLAAARPA